MEAPIVLIDGLSLVFRAYHALQRTGMKSPSGEPSFAVFAFANILTSIIDKHSPECMAVIFDTAQPTFRHEMYDQYKANRDAFPEDLVPQLGRIKELVKLMGLAQLELPGFEADDIVGTICKREGELGHQVLCVTSDKDYFQLVNNNVKILRPGKDVGEYDVYDDVKVKEKFGVGPEKVIDVLALMGDASDNVPGVKGIGEKTAIPLIEQFGTLESLYENLDKVERESVRKKLDENKDNAFLSKTLVTIHTDVPVTSPKESMRRTTADIIALENFCDELGFHTLKRRFQKFAGKTDVVDGEGADPNSESDDSANNGLKKLADVPHEYILVDTPGGLDEMMSDLKGCTLLSADLETTGLDAMACSIVGVALCAKEGKAYYIDVDDVSDPSQANLFSESTDSHGLPIADVLKTIKPLLENKEIGKCGQNLKFDSLILRRYGVVVSPIAFDTMLASYVLNPDVRHNLDALSERWLEYSPISITTLIGKTKSSQISMKEVDAAIVAEYAAEDADLALKLANILKNELEKENLTKLAYELEFPVEEVLVVIEHNGVRIDNEALGDLGDFMRTEGKRLEQLIWKEAGVEFNIASNKQLGDVLFEQLMLPKGKKTKTGFSTDSSVLSELSETYPIAQMILDFRQVEKLRSTYVEALPRLTNKTTGRVHTTFNQTVAATGRLSSTDPNLQNIPIRSELGLRIRKAFVPQREDSVIMSADYSQIELRIMASYCQDESLVNAFKNGEDVHSATAANLFDIEIASVDGDQRRIAKTVNFGIMYGLGAFGLAQRLGVSRTEAVEIINNYFNKYPGIRQYIDDTIAKTRQAGFAETLMGRRRYFPTIDSNNRGLRTAAERASINMPIQGSAADMMKLAMIKVHGEMQRLRMQSLLILQVHDELLFEARKDELDVLTALVKTNMESALPLVNVPIVVETGFGKSWFEAH
ncbi:MAG: DNA polymerase I [Ignavibacteria bacterium]|nr:DNA polymerase I [Ignavibacteria bacterium]